MQKITYSCRSFYRRSLDTLINNMSKIVIDKPDYYNQGNIECIDAMESAYGIKAVADFCRCNAFKYQWRAGLKAMIIL